MLDWQPKHSDLATIVQTCHAWRHGQVAKGASRQPLPVLGGADTKAVVTFVRRHQS